MARAQPVVTRLALLRLLLEERTSIAVFLCSSCRTPLTFTRGFTMSEDVQQVLWSRLRYTGQMDLHNPRIISVADSSSSRQQAARGRGATVLFACSSCSGVRGQATLESGSWPRTAKDLKQLPSTHEIAFASKRVVLARASPLGTRVLQPDRADDLSMADQLRFGLNNPLNFHHRIDLNNHVNNSEGVVSEGWSALWKKCLSLKADLTMTRLKVKLSNLVWWLSGSGSRRCLDNLVLSTAGWHPSLGAHRAVQVWEVSKEPVKDVGQVATLINTCCNTSFPDCGDNRPIDVSLNLLRELARAGREGQLTPPLTELEPAVTVIAERLGRRTHDSRISQVIEHLVQLEVPISREDWTKLIYSFVLSAQVDAIIAISSLWRFMPATSHSSLSLGVRQYAKTLWSDNDDPLTLTHYQEHFAFLLKAAYKARKIKFHDNKKASEANRCVSVLRKMQQSNDPIVRQALVSANPLSLVLILAEANRTAEAYARFTEYMSGEPIVHEHELFNHALAEMLQSLLKTKQFAQGRSLFELCLREGRITFPSRGVMYPTIRLALAQGDLASAYNYLSLGFHYNSVRHPEIVRVASACADVGDTVRLNQILEWYPKITNQLVRGYCVAGKIPEALKIVKRLDENLSHSERQGVYSGLLGGLVEMNQWDIACKIWQRIGHQLWHVELQAGELDLHEMTKPIAQMAVLGLLLDLRKSYFQQCLTSRGFVLHSYNPESVFDATALINGAEKLTIVTGRGKNSINQESVLRPVISKFLGDLGLEIMQSHEGSFAVLRSHLVRLFTRPFPPPLIALALSPQPVRNPPLFLRNYQLEMNSRSNFEPERYPVEMSWHAASSRVQELCSLGHWDRAVQIVARTSYWDKCLFSALEGDMDLSHARDNTSLKAVVAACLHLLSEAYQQSVPTHARGQRGHIFDTEAVINGKRYLSIVAPTNAHKRAVESIIGLQSPPATVAWNGSVTKVPRDLLLQWLASPP